MDAAASRFWIFQAHPERYDVATRVAVGGTDSWVVSSHATELGIGDIAFVWRAASEKALYGWAVVNSEVFEASGLQSEAIEAESAAPASGELRVELAYRVRFEKPITRAQIRSRGKLRTLEPMRTAAGTNFLLEPADALALNEFLRERGLEAPPDPAAFDDGMPAERQPGPVRWERLSPSSHEALGWAAASETAAGRTGTRGILVGLVRLTDRESEAVQLLRFAGRDTEELFEALRKVRPQPQINPHVEEPYALTDLPELTDNARNVLEHAFRLQDDPSGLVESRHLFGGLLAAEKSRAFEALASVVEGRVPIERLVETYPAYLRSATAAYREFLERQFGAQDTVEWISDSVAKDDVLKRRALAGALAVRLRRIHSQDPNASFLIHVDGPWGSGKSTLLDHLADELGDQRSPETDPWLVVRYDAWRQTRVGPPWWTLLIQLRETLKSGLPRRRHLRLWSSQALTRLRTAGLLYLLVLAIAVALFVLIGPDQVTAYLTAISALVAGALAVGRFFLWDSAQGARIFENVQRNPMESLSDQFALLIKRSPSPVVFLVDELDRCGSEQVVDLLDSIQTLVRDAPRKRELRRPARRPGGHSAPYFVIAADGAWIRRSYEVAHERMTEAVAEPGRPLGHLFLAKIFQLTVKMPSLSPELRAVYLRSLLHDRHPDGEAQSSEQAATAEHQLGRATHEDEVLDLMKRATPEARQALAPLAVERLNADRVERETEEHVLDKFGELLEPNPRAIKRVVIAYGIERSVRTLEGSLVSRDTLMLWTILNTRWPGLGEYLTERPDAIDDLSKRSVPKDVPAELAPLFQADAVSKVVRFSPGGPLTKALVADAAGISLEEPRRVQPTQPGSVTGRGAS